ncbi:MAG: hypothetical protein PVH62_00615 [Anaerolineae bacterium]
MVTHAHTDHAWRLRDGAPCPVYATEESWEGMDDLHIEDRRLMPNRQPVEIEGIAFEAFPVDHSTRAPAVGYRITAGEVVISTRATWSGYTIGRKRSLEPGCTSGMVPPSRALWCARSAMA